MSTHFSSILRLSLIIVAGMLIALAAGGGPASAAAIVVNTTDDESNSDGDCSLREAVEAANTDAAVDACTAGSGADSITVPAGTYVLTDGDLGVTTDMTINGAGAADTMIDGGGANLVFDIFESDVTVVISDLTVQNGNGGNGGGIYNDSTLTLNNVTVKDNAAEGGGGGIYNDTNGTTTLNGSTVSNNTAGGNGGGIFNYGPDTLNLIDSTVSGNEAANDGGGVRNQYDASSVIEGSTISGNTAGSDGGGISSDLCCDAETTISNSTVSGNVATGLAGGIENVGSVMTLTNVTIANNTANGEIPQVSASALGQPIEVGGGIYNDTDGTVNMVNTIVAGNEGDDCGGVDPSSDGHNLDSDGTCGLAGTGDQSGVVDPLLEALADNGGPTQTQALAAESPAVDTADDAACPDTDQRGFPRPWDGDGDSTDTCDIGAYELIPDTDGDGVLDAFDACINDPEDLDGVDDTDGCPEVPAQPTATPAQLPLTGGTPGSGDSGLTLAFALAATTIALAGAGGALVAVRRRR